MSDKINKRVTELLGECWHEWEWTYNSGECKICDKSVARGLVQFENRNYAGNIADAWELVEFMASKDFEMMLDACEGSYSVSFHETQTGKEMVDIKNNSAPMAIALAFIKVMEGK